MSSFISEFSPIFFRLWIEYIIVHNNMLGHLILKSWKLIKLGLSFLLKFPKLTWTEHPLVTMLSLLSAGHLSTFQPQRTGNTGDTEQNVRPSATPQVENRPDNRRWNDLFTVSETSSVCPRSCLFITRKTSRPDVSADKKTNLEPPVRVTRPQFIGTYIFSKSKRLLTSEFWGWEMPSVASVLKTTRWKIQGTFI